MTNSLIKQSQQVNNAFVSMLRTDYISIDDINQLVQLEEYYIDFYNNIGSLLQKQDNFVYGRRGTGKTTLLYRGYFECLKTIDPRIKNPSSYFGSNIILPIYIDLVSCNELFNSTDNQQLIEMHFVRQIIISLKKQIDLMFDETFLGIFKKNNPALEDLDYIESLLITGLAIKKTNKGPVVEKTKHIDKASLKSAISILDQSVEGTISVDEEREKSKESIELRGLNVQDFLGRITDIRKKANINSIFVFIDEFSELQVEDQIKFSILLKKFLGSKNNVYFKIGTITDQYTFGDKIIIGRDLFPISLDLNEYVEKIGGYPIAIKELEKFAEELITKRLEIFCSDIKKPDIFKIPEATLYRKLTLESLGIPRIIGIILQHAWILCKNRDKILNKIGDKEINYGISSCRKMHFLQFEGGIKKGAIPAYNFGMWNAILENAILEKNKQPDRPASHFLVSPNRKNYLKVLCENFLIHFLEENRGTKVGKKYNLYCIDFDVCREFGIKFAEEKDEFSSSRFIYDSILSKYDPYFTDEIIKSYRCPKCQRIYEESELGAHKTKRCIDDDEKLIEILHKEVQLLDANYSDTETKILGIITNLDEKDAMSARQIADIVGCHVQKVAIWSTKVLTKKNLVKIKNNGVINLYYS